MGAGKLLLGLGVLGGIVYLAVRKKDGTTSGDGSSGTWTDDPTAGGGEGATDDNAAGFDWPRVLQAVSGQEGAYGTLNPNDVNRGVSWGIIQFNQGAGSLGQVLKRWKELDPAGFTTWWQGNDRTDYGSQLIRILTDSSDAVRLSVALGSGVYADKLREAGKLAVVQQAQQELAWTMYMFPLLPLIGQTFGGINDVVAGVVFDRSVNQGPGFVKTLLGRILTEYGPAEAGDWGGRLEQFRVRAAQGGGPAAARITARLARVTAALA